MQNRSAYVKNENSDNEIPRVVCFLSIKKKQGNCHWIVGTYMFQQRSDPNSDPNWSPHVRIRVRKTK
jgi:hypothetical protein